MKKAVVFVVLAMVVISICAAQSTNSDAQRIVGTWVAQGLTLTFGSDGALSGMSGFNKWAISGNTLVFIGSNNNVKKLGFFITPDVRTLALDADDDWMVLQKR